MPFLLRATADGVIATYNTPTVYELIVSAVREAGMDPEHLAEPSNWRCISQARSDRLGQPQHYFAPRAADHALGRCHGALVVLRDIATARPNLVGGRP